MTSHWLYLFNTIPSPYNYDLPFILVFRLSQTTPTINSNNQERANVKVQDTCLLVSWFCQITKCLFCKVVETSEMDTV